VFEAAYAEYPITIPSCTAFVSGAFADMPFSPGSGMDRGFDTFRFFQEGKCHRPVVEGRTFEDSHAYFPVHAPGRERDFYRKTMINRQ